jgi:hypothetical protein
MDDQTNSMMTVTSHKQDGIGYMMRLKSDIALKEKNITNR